MPARLELANAIRALSMDAVQRANSGHPGMPMGMADIAEVLWNDHLRHHPGDPHWPDRDRFVVSNGHGSMLLYALLHLSGYDLPVDELKNFRKLHSRTPGHPEHGLTPGVETTTGPLGQGLANAVGMALAERLLAARFNRDGHEIVDHRTWVFAGDGCLMEGISHEACSLAGTLGLDRLVVFYDDNGISIDGEVDGWYRDDTPARFEAYGWQVIRNVDGHDPDELQQAIETAKQAHGQPTLIQCRTTIGWGAPNKQGKAAAHGAALGDDEVALARETLGWPHPPFEVPDEIRGGWDARARGQALQQDWAARFTAYEKAFPDDAAEFRRRLSGALPPDWPARVATLVAERREGGTKMATRKASHGVLNTIAPVLPELLGGSADLTESNLTRWEGAQPIRPGRVAGNYLYYGVREFGMSAVMNGLALHGGFIPFGGTFLTFSDYARNALRMAALMKQRSIFVYTHDSIGLGEDGPTHQAVEHLAALRVMPNLEVWRPADAFETAIAWQAALERVDGPSVLSLTRQGVPVLEHDADHHAQVLRGGYVLWNSGDKPELLFLATGSEVGLALDAARRVADGGTPVRVVSLPCAQRFLAQDAAWRDAVLPPAATRRLAIEAGVTHWWRALVGAEGDVMGVDTYGESAPAQDVYGHFGLTVDGIVDRADRLLGRAQSRLI